MRTHYNVLMNNPVEIAANYVGIAKNKTSQAWYKSLILGVLAGAFIAFGGVVATVAGAGYTGVQAALVKGAVFPLGLILVVLCGAELFTGNCLLVAPLCNRDIKLLPTLKSFGLVYLGNFIGAVFVAVIAVYCHVFGDPTAESAMIASACVSTAAAKSTAGFGDIFLRGILCNILVCLAVWGAMSSKSAAGKVLAVYMPIFAFVVCGFEHSIANMYYIISGLLASGEYGIAAIGLNFGSGMLNLLASTLGNIVGGALVDLAYFAVFFRRGDKRDDNKASAASDRDGGDVTHSEVENDKDN